MFGVFDPLSSENFNPISYCSSYWHIYILNEEFYSELGHFALSKMIIFKSLDYPI